MDDASDNKTTMPINQDRIDDFLLSELENNSSSLASEREMASGMVSHFFTLVVASIGGFVYLKGEKTKQETLIEIYVFLVGLVLLVFGISVFIRLIKCHFDRKAFQEGRNELYYTVKTRYKETHLGSYYQSIEVLNKELGDFSQWYKNILNFGGSGIAIALVNMLIATVLFIYGYSLVKELLATVLFLYGYSLVKELHISCFILVYVLVGGYIARFSLVYILVGGLFVVISFQVFIYCIQKRAFEGAKGKWETYKTEIRWKANS